MKIIVLSDLHTGPKAIAEEFNTDCSSLHAVKKNYLKDFEKFIKTEEIKADYLFITGDISDRATYKEFELAEKRIKKCAEILSVDASNIYFVPGNHDSNWELEEFSIEQGEPEEAVILSKYKYLRDNAFFKSILDRAEFGDFYKEPYFVYWSDENYGLSISRAAFTGGKSPFEYVPAFNASLFLSANEEDVEKAIDAGFPSGRSGNRSFYHDGRT